MRIMRCYSNYTISFKYVLAYFLTRPKWQKTRGVLAKPLSQITTPVVNPVGSNSTRPRSPKVTSKKKSHAERFCRKAQDSVTNLNDLKTNSRRNFRTRPLVICYYPNLVVSIAWSRKSQTKSPVAPLSYSMLKQQFWRKIIVWYLKQPRIVCSTYRIKHQWPCPVCNIIPRLWNM